MSAIASGLVGKRSYSDIVLAFGVVAIVALMILPLPILLIDILVALNILIGVGLLLLAIYVPNPVAFSSFPSVLLITTLFRLSLAIAITRKILLEADGGHIIDTFGNMVVGGNLVVGIVIFLIITVVQFIVVAKGAERVAEVAARFTLDAMPGKQLSIDSDLRSGLIDKDEARRRRRLLETESQLHGSLDGAMKFVKGDAIAGIVIIIVNLLGGLAVGIMQMGMAVGEAVHTYSILTIGDGLVSQIPALLASISAGLLVTRTTGEEDHKHLGEAISRQIGKEPRVALIAGCVALLLLFVPGFPKPAFLVLALALLGFAAWRMRERVAFLRRLFRVPEANNELATRAQSLLEGDFVPMPGLLLEIERGTGTALGPARVRDALQRLVADLREEFGVPVPAPTMRSNERLQDGGYRLYAFGVRIGAGVIRADGRFLPGAVAGGDGALVPAQPNFMPPFEGAWVGAAGDAAADTRSLAPLEALTTHVRTAVERHLGLFIGIQETSNLFTRMSRDYPDLVKEMLRVLAPQRVAEVLKRLVDEGVPIRNLRDVFEAIADAGSREKDIVMLTEYVRVALRRHISDRHAAEDRTLKVLVVHPELEDKLRSSVRVTNAGAQLAVDPELAAHVLAQIGEWRRAEGGFAGTALLGSLDVRRHLRKLTEIEYFELPVLSFQELVPDIKLTPLGQVTA
ncbi:MAG TPA: type III secretion system export apparatus subunit SctV [Dokdonella sp.]|uniref:type III secretion system export apparatus subunit SctV n=1 Tax=Dokdonella sp. TaxID=2291710 RepID=UPI0025C3F752|nr:type III secretion system export apparatus subunit SctV [Dokdonella sp.]MBX3691605.1 type III secretion system export apparatus subunit SctV [Dokdonella sp.]MCW5567884.1 type III secretion system export apparatus subunit SctV [Dokdonella sp.]HNR90885.1 type III secretion system export apparatus subunit SctV [Dokdonella sp.]